MQLTEDGNSIEETMIILKDEFDDHEIEPALARYNKNNSKDSDWQTPIHVV